MPVVSSGTFNWIRPESSAHRPHPVAIGFLVGTLIGLAAGCRATNQAEIDLARSAFAYGDLPTARQQLVRLVEQADRDAVPAELDLAIVELASGEARAAESRLRRLRDSFDESGGQQFAHDAASLLADDRIRQFQAAPYEQVLIRAMLAVCSLSQDASDAESYLHQAVMKQADLDRQFNDERTSLLDDPSHVPPSQPIAFAPYMRGVLREATHRDYDDARRSYQLVSSIRPTFLPAADDRERASHGVHSQPGHGVLYVIALVGEGPRLQSVDAPLTSAALSAASTMLLTQIGDEDDVPPLPSIKTVRVPGVLTPDSPLAAIQVSHDVGVFSDQRFVGATQSITDINEMMRAEVSARQPMVMARAVARRAMKEAAVEAARRKLELGGATGSLFGWAASSAWVATEDADTRSWSLLPRDIQILRTELPVGRRDIQLTPVGWYGEPIGPPIRRTVTVDDGRNSYLTVIAPSTVVYAVGPSSLEQS
ncbi:MAG: hypothetical protein AAGC97_11800 [Planctomycetota bacterium]